MTTNILSASVDLDTLFAPHTSANAAATNILVNGADINTRYDVIASPALVNAGARIPAINISSLGTNLASIFCGNTGQYSVTAPINGAQTMASGFSSGQTITRNLYITFASAAALTNYFYYGGRILLSASQTGGSTVADADLAAMLASSGSLIIYDQGHYTTGAGNIFTSSIGGSNIGTGLQPIFQIGDAAPYTSVYYTVYMEANGAVGAANQLHLSIQLQVAQAGTIADFYSGTYTSYANQRNHPTQAVPSFT